MADPHDDMDELLAPPAPAETPGLRDAVLRATLRRLARTRRVRSAVRIAAVAAVFAAGVGVGLLRTPGERERVVVVREVEVVAVPVVVPVMVAPAEPPSPPAPVRAARLELDAELADGPAAAALYRRAGDAYLTGEQDYANAARCYRLFLARAGDTALSPEAGDSWLLTSLKNAAFTEKAHATATHG